MKFSKIRDVKSPSRGTPRSAGIDFYVPAFDEKFVDDLRMKNPQLRDEHIRGQTIILEAHERILIPSGIKVRFEGEKMLAVMNKSGVAAKKGLDKLAEVIDADYQGEVHLNFHNTNISPVVITEGEKLAQMVLVPISLEEIQEISADELYVNHESERGEGGFGSTNKDKF